MKKILDLALGVVTSIGGFLEVGSIATSAQAGSEFGYQLAWAVLLGCVSLAILMEATGRLALVSKRTYADQLRERFGVRFFMLPLVVTLLVSFLVLASEIGGVSLALQMVTGVSFQVWALPVALLGWFLLYRGNFTIVEQGTALLGLVTIAFAVAAVKLHPQWGTFAASLVPSRPTDDEARYWFLAVSILGASISPYLYFFYSAGALEDKWDVEHVSINRVTAGLGNMFGGGLAIMVLVVAAIVFEPRGIQVDRYEVLGVMMTPALGAWGFAAFVMSLFVTCFGTTAEITLAIAYLIAQGFGWEWGENEKPRENARFTLAYTLVIVLAAIPMALGVDPLKLTNISMAATAASLPFSVIPLLVLMNDEDVMSRYRNGWLANALLVAVALLAIVLIFAAFPLQALGGG